MSMYYGQPSSHRPSILQRPLRSESQMTAENMDAIAAKEAAMLEVKRQQYQQTHERLARSLYPSDLDKQAYYQAMQDHMEQQARARETERLAEMARMEKYAASRPMTPNANDLQLQSQPWKATTHTAYGNQQEQEQARRAIAKSILDENRALALQQAASKARARDEDRMEGKRALGTDSFWSAPAPLAHRRSPLSSHNGAPFALHDSTAPAHSYMQPVQLSYQNDPVDEGLMRSYHAAGVASSRPTSAMGRSMASPPPSTLAPWASDFSRDIPRDQTTRPASAQVSFPWSRDIPLTQSLKGRGEHNPGYPGYPGYDSKSKPFADLADLAQAQAATQQSRAAYQRSSPAFPWLA